MKSKLNKKLPAFTLIEISITILLSLIVVGMMYMALHIISREIEQPEDKKMEQVALLKNAFSHAFDEALVINWSEEEQALYCIDSMDIRTFRMTSDAIVFSLPDALPDTLWKGSYLYQTDLTESNLIGQIKLGFPLKADTLWVNENKVYSPATLLNHKKISFEY